MKLPRGFLNACSTSLLGLSILVIYFRLFNVHKEYSYPGGIKTAYMMNAKNFSVSGNSSIKMWDGTHIYQFNMSQLKAEFPYMQSYQCRLVIEIPGFCQTTDNCSLLLLATKTHPVAIESRVAQRQTWAMDRKIYPFCVKHVFLIAQSVDLADMQQVTEENRKFKDILLWDFTDSYYNRSLKERCFIEWLHSNCKEAEFIFKGDNDEFVNINGVVKYLTRMTNASPRVHGCIKTQSYTDVSGKYKITKAAYPSETYPTFPAGCGYIIPGAYIASLYHATTWMPLFPMDEVYFGFLGLAAQVAYQHDSRFCITSTLYSRCVYQRALVVLDISPHKLIDIWQDFQTEDSCRPLNVLHFVLLVIIVLWAFSVFLMIPRGSLKILRYDAMYRVQTDSCVFLLAPDLDRIQIL